MPRADGTLRVDSAAWARKEMWSNRATTVKCFDALRVWALHERRRREVDDADVEPTGAQVARWQLRDAERRGA